jgi:hypothetical protein
LKSLPDCRTLFRTYGGADRASCGGQFSTGWLQRSIEVLNELELSTEGVNLFSGIASVDGRTVHVGATPAWDALPAVGKQSYLDSLLDLWVAAQGGQGPAAVRIVDPSGRVLAEKSEP